MKKLFPIVSFACIIFAACKKIATEPSDNVTVTTFAGSGADGFADGNGTAAKFSGPLGITIDAQGNIYVADSHKPRIRKITPDATVSTLAGNGIFGYVDGSSSVAQFTDPNDVATDAQGNVYVTESNRIRKITSSGEVSTLTGGGAVGYADGDLSSAQFGWLQGIAIDDQGNIYVTDWGTDPPNSGGRIRKIAPNGLVSTLAGNSIAGFADGNGSSAQFYNPYGITTDPQGNIYIADYANRRVRKITPAGTVSTLTAIGTDVVSGPTGVAAGARGNIYVVESGAFSGNDRIHKITPSGTTTVLAGSASGYADGSGSTALFKGPHGIVVDAQENIYVSDYLDNRIRKISIK